MPTPTPYNQQELIEDIKRCLPVLQICEKHSIPRHIVYYTKYAHIKKKRPSLPLGEKICRAVERGWSDATIYKRYGIGEEVKKALQFARN